MKHGMSIAEKRKLMDKDTVRFQVFEGGKKVRVTTRWQGKSAAT